MICGTAQRKRGSGMFKMTVNDKTGRVQILKDGKPILVDKIDYDEWYSDHDEYQIYFKYHNVWYNLAGDIYDEENDIWYSEDGYLWLPEEYLWYDCYSNRWYDRDNDEYIPETRPVAKVLADDFHLDGFDFMVDKNQVRTSKWLDEQRAR